MKVELIEEKKLGQELWYEVRVDDKYITGSYEKEKVEEFYNNIVENPNFINERKIVLKSKEIENV